MRTKNNLNITLEDALRKRATIREMTGGAISRDVLDKLVWAAYGNTHNDGKYKLRTAPSAGATYPIEVHLAAERVEGLADGIYRYDSGSEKLLPVRPGSFLKSICAISLDQDFIPLSNLAFVLAYHPAKIEKHYGRESRKYALLECGHIAQNILLMTSALGLGGVPVGAFYHKKLGSIIDLAGNREALYMICVGTIDS